MPFPSLYLYVAQWPLCFTWVQVGYLMAVTCIVQTLGGALGFRLVYPRFRDAGMLVVSAASGVIAKLWYAVPVYNTVYIFFGRFIPVDLQKVYIRRSKTLHRCIKRGCAQRAAHLFLNLSLTIPCCAEVPYLSICDCSLCPLFRTSHWIFNLYSRADHTVTHVKNSRLRRTRYFDNDRQLTEIYVTDIQFHLRS